MIKAVAAATVAIAAFPLLVIVLATASLNAPCRQAESTFP